MEISQDNISEAPVETKVKLTNDIIRLLQVREKNEAMAKDWLLFLATTPKFFKLTAGEIYEAFKMAMARELLDQKGNEIEMLPELSINTASKVLNSYLIWKRENSAYQLAKADLHQKYNPIYQPKQTPEEIREEYLLQTFDEISKTNYSSSAWILYPDVEEMIVVSVAVKKRLYNWQFKKYVKEYKSEIKSKGNKKHHEELLQEIIQRNNKGKASGVVANRCRAIVVCNYLKKFKTLEEFLKAIPEPKPLETKNPE